MNREARPAKIFCQADLSGWLTPDEERLLNLYRDSPTDARARLLYQLTRERFLAHRLEENYDPVRDRNDPTWYHHELMEELRLIKPEPPSEPDVFWDDPDAWNALMAAAWPEGYDKVVLGSEAHDGMHADRLLEGLHRVWDFTGPGPEARAPLALTLHDCLTYVERWRLAAFAWVFRAES